MTIDDRNWDPLSLAKVATIFRSSAAPWWIAGGWALDLFLGRQGRAPTDTDVLILRRDQLAVQDALRGPWEIFKTHQPGLAPCLQAEFLEPPVNCFRVRRPGSTRAFAVRLMETEDEEWVCQQQRSVRGPIRNMGRATPDGIPYLRPEIQLLYKSGTNRKKDFSDLERVLPHLSADAVAWLLDALRQQYPAGHERILRVECAAA